MLKADLGCIFTYVRKEDFHGHEWKEIGGYGVRMVQPVAADDNIRNGNMARKHLSFLIVDGC